MGLREFSWIMVMALIQERIKLCCEVEMKFLSFCIVYTMYLLVSNLKIKRERNVLHHYLFGGFFSDRYVAI